MSNVISLNAPVARPSRGSADLSRGTAAARGLLLPLATFLERGRDAAALRGWSDRELRDVGLARQDLGRSGGSVAWDAGTGAWTPPRGF